MIFNQQTSEGLTAEILVRYWIAGHPADFSRSFFCQGLAWVAEKEAIEKKQKPPVSVKTLYNMRRGKGASEKTIRELLLFVGATKMPQLTIQ